MKEPGPGTIAIERHCRDEERPAAELEAFEYFLSFKGRLDFKNE